MDFVFIIFYLIFSQSNQVNLKQKKLIVTMIQSVYYYY